MSQDRLIDIHERSRITGEGRSTIFARIKAGQITAVKDGRRTLFSEAEAFAHVQAKLATARHGAAA